MKTPISSSASSHGQKNERKITPHLNLVNRFQGGVNFRSFFCPRLEDEFEIGVFLRSCYLYSMPLQHAVAILPWLKAEKDP